jgi:hypothetical protein
MQEKLITIFRDRALLVLALCQIIAAVFAAIVIVINFLVSSFQTTTKKDKLNAESKLILAKANSIDVHDQLNVIEITQKFIRNGLALEELISKKNEIIAELEDEEYELKLQIEGKDTQVRALERQLGLRTKQPETEEKTGS